MGGPDTKVGCLGARVKGSDPQAPYCCPGVVVGAVVEAVSSSLAVGTVAPPLALGQATPTMAGDSSSSSSGYWMAAPPQAVGMVAPPSLALGTAAATPWAIAPPLALQTGRQPLLLLPSRTVAPPTFAFEDSNSSLWLFTHVSIGSLRSASGGC
ncbi:UNVERIFIED_CONTAM: hypothetical protein FKN15_038676 [Acipenser sinensis]